MLEDQLRQLSDPKDQHKWEAIEIELCRKHSFLLSDGARSLNALEAAPAGCDSLAEVVLHILLTTLSSPAMVDRCIYLGLTRHDLELAQIETAARVIRKHGLRPKTLDVIRPKFKLHNQVLGAIWHMELTLALYSAFRRPMLRSLPSSDSEPRSKQP